MKSVKRKIIVLFILFMGLFYLLSVNNKASAKVIPNSIFSYCPNRSFNYCKGILDNENFDEYLYDDFNRKVGEYIKDGYLDTLLPGDLGSERVFITEKMYVTNGILCEVEYLYEEEPFFRAKINNKKVEVLLDRELDFASITGDINARFDALAPCINLREVVPYNYALLDELYDVFRDYCFRYLSGLVVLDNTLYKDLDCYIVMEYNNKLSLEEIKDSIYVHDNSNNFRFEIVENTYDEKSSGVGSYYMIVLAYDEYYHYTKQKVNIEIRDDIAPVIKIKEPIIVDYNTSLTNEELIKYFDIIEESKYTYKFDLDKYNKNELGTYNLTLEVVDEYNNISTYDFNITVKDTTAPVVTHLNISIDNLYKRTLEELIELANFKAIDNYDGNVISKLKFDDEYEYEKKYYLPGVYRINYSIEDSLGNTCNSYFTISVLDVDYPTIEIGKYCILKEKGSEITKEEVLELLKNSGYSVSLTSIEGECFNLTSLDGEYSFIYEDNGIIKEGIVLTNEDVKVLDDIDSMTIIDNNESNNQVIIFVVIGLVSIVSLVILITFVYKKKH